MGAGNRVPSVPALRFRRSTPKEGSGAQGCRGVACSPGKGSGSAGLRSTVSRSYYVLSPVLVDMLLNYLPVSNPLNSLSLTLSDICG